MTITSIPAATRPAEPKVLVTTHFIPLEHKQFPITTPSDKTNIPRKEEEMSLVESWVVLQACHAGLSQLHGSAGSSRTGPQIRKRSHATYPYLAHTTSNFLLSITSVSVHFLFLSAAFDNYSSPNFLDSKHATTQHGRRSHSGGVPSCSLRAYICKYSLLIAQPSVD